MGGFAFATKLVGIGTGTQSDQYGLYLSPIQPPDGSLNGPNHVINSIAILAPLPNGIGGNPGYAQAAVAETAGGPPTGWINQQNLYDGVGNDGNADAGQPGLNDNTLVYGSPTATATYPNGVASVQVRSNAWVWALQQRLVPGDGAPQGGYGASTSVFGNLALVASTVGSGPAIYAFARTGSVWAQIQQFQPADIGPSDGLAVGAQTGNQLFLSALTQNSNQGAVYVYTFVGGVFTQVQKLVGAAGDFFGISVSCDGSTLVIGAVGNGAGKAYVYTPAGGGTWNLLTTLTSSDGMAGDDFGNGVAVNGTLMCIGARNAAVGAVTFAGAAYIFQFAAGTWTQTQKLVSTVPTTLTYFGWATSVYAGNPSWVAVGQPAVGNATVEGAVFFYIGPAIAPLVDPFVTLTMKGEKVYT